MGLLLGNTETFQNVQDCFALYFKLSGQIIDSNFHPLSSFLSKLYVIISTSRRNFTCLREPFTQRTPATLPYDSVPPGSSFAASPVLSAGAPALSSAAAGSVVSPASAGGAASAAWPSSVCASGAPAASWLAGASPAGAASRLE
jgi:hypothetical protein